MAIEFLLGDDILLGRQHSAPKWIDLLASETIDADQDNCLADGTEMVVGVLGMLRGEKPKH